MPERHDWIADMRRDLGRLADDRNPAKRRPAARSIVDAVYLGWHYQAYPVLGALSWDVEQFDLAMRRAAYATHGRVLVEGVVEADIRLPRRLGLQLRGSTPGSLELLIDIPSWIVVALASQPTTALVNLIALLSTKEAIRVQLRRLVLNESERKILARHGRPPAELPSSHDITAEQAEPPSLASGETARVAGSDVRQGELAPEIAARLADVEPVVDVEIGHVRVRTSRPAIDVVVQEGETITSVSIREPRR